MSNEVNDTERFLIKDITPADAAFVASYAATCDGIKSVKNIKRIEVRWKESLKDKSHIGFIAWNGDKRIGFQDGFVKNDKLELNEIYVVPRFRRKNIGMSLLSAMVSYAKANNLKKISLTTETDNASMLGLAKKLGFKEQVKGNGVYCEIEVPEALSVAKSSTVKKCNQMEQADFITESEIVFSTSLGGQAFKNSNFVLMHNPHVDWGGDFNRVIGCRIRTVDDLVDIQKQVERIILRHGFKAIINRYDALPPSLDENTFRKPLKGMSVRLENNLWFKKNAMPVDIPKGFCFTEPSDNEFSSWFHKKEKRTTYHDETAFKSLLPLKQMFARIFKPYWLMKNDTLCAWVYCAIIGDYGRLFEVEVAPEFRGKGIGKILLNAITNKVFHLNGKSVVLQSGESLRAFYEKAGFIECGTNSTLWKR